MRILRPAPFCGAVVAGAALCEPLGDERRWRST